MGEPQFNVNEAKKKAITKAVLKAPSAARFVLRLANGILCGALIIGFVFLLWNLIDPSRHVVLVRDIPKKDYLTIWFNFITVAAVGVALFILTRTLGVSLGGRDIRERADETLVFQDGKLYYAFRTRYITPLEGRNLVVIPLDEIHEIGYDDRTCAIHLFGRFSSDAYVDFDAECNSEPSSGNLSGITIYNYFDPDLYQFICEWVPRKYGGAV